MTIKMIFVVFDIVIDTQAAALEVGSAVINNRSLCLVETCLKSSILYRYHTSATGGISLGSNASCCRLNVSNSGFTVACPAYVGDN